MVPPRSLHELHTPYETTHDSAGIRAILFFSRSRSSLYVPLCAHSLPRKLESEARATDVGSIGPQTPRFHFSSVADYATVAEQIKPWF